MRPWIRRCQNILTCLTLTWFVRYCSLGTLGKAGTQPGTAGKTGTTGTLGTAVTAGTIGTLGTAGTRLQAGKTDTPGALRTAGPSYYITGSNSCRWRRILCNDFTSYIKAHTHLLWWKLKVRKRIINWGRGSKKLLCCTKLWNWVSSWWEIVTNAYMTIFPWKYFYYSCELANQTAALGRCRTTICLIFTDRRSSQKFLEKSNFQGIRDYLQRT